jgi:peroxiredoxin
VTVHLKKLCVVVSAITIVFLAVSCTRSPEKVSDSGKAPDFTLSDTQGIARTLSALRGRVVIVEFWATWCPPCRESVAELNKVYEKFKGKNFELFGISVDKGSEASSTVRTFVKEHAVTYPVMLDDRNVNSSYGVSNIPVMFVIDKEGKVVKKFTGFIPGLGEVLSKEVEALL